MNIDQWLARIDAWDPAEGDLPDDLARAMDQHEVLRARFDARFVPVDVPLDAIPETALDPVRLLPPANPARPRRRLTPVVIGFVVASGIAASVLGVFGVALTATDAYRPAATVVNQPVARVPPTASVRIDGQLQTVPTSGPRVSYLLGGSDDDKRITVDEWTARTRAGVDGTVDIILGQRDGWVYREGRFDDPGVGAWIDTASEPASTFSIDVDRGSYTYGRRMLRDGRLPEPESVRVEEYVNAVDYDYAPPDDGRFAVQLEASPSPWNDARYVVRVGVKARPGGRVPVHLTFLVDTSGSMQGTDRLDLVKYALGRLADQLGDGDTVSVVAYAGSAGVVLPPTAATDRAAIRAAIGRLAAGGSTAMGEGIALAYAQADDMRRPGEISRVVIASDGDANVGVTDTGALSELIRTHARRGIALTTLGFGTGNYQDARMEQLADDGDGNYFYVDSREEAERVFVDELRSTLEIVARDVKLQVDWNPDAVARYRLLGYENRALANRDFRDDAVDAGDIGAGHTVTALYAVELVPGGASPVATVRVRSKPPGPDAPSTEGRFILPRGAVHPSFAEATAAHRLAIGTAAFAERLRASPYVAGLGYGEIVGVVQGARRAGHPGDDELLELIRRAAELSSSTDGALTITLDGASPNQHATARCSDGSTSSAEFEGSTAVLRGLPPNGSCHWALAGPGPRVFGQSSVGDAITCAYDPTTAELRCTSEPGARAGSVARWP